MRTWDNFYKDLLVMAPGCPEPMADYALLRAAQEFFKATRIDKLFMDPITLKANPADLVHSYINYDVPLPRNREIVRIEKALLNTRTIDVVTQDLLPPDWMTNGIGISECVFTLDRKTVNVLPSRDVTLIPGGYTLVLQCSLTPSDKAIGIENDQFDLYAEAISWGAAARLMLQPKKPYTDVNLGALKRAEFMDAIGMVSIQNWRGFSSARPRASVKTF